MRNLDAKLKLLILCAGLALSYQFSQAQGVPTRLPPISGPISSALGGAGLVSTEQSEAGFVNPAGLVVAKAQGLAVVHQDGFFAQDIEQEFSAITIVDPMTVPEWPTSISYATTKIKYSGADEIEGQYINLSFARSLFQRLSLGVSVLHSSYSLDGENFTEWNSSMGFMYNPLSSLLIGIKYSHLIPPDDIPKEIKLAPEFGVGAEYDIRNSLKIRAELARPEDQNEDKKWVLKTGFQAPVGSFLLYRMGYRYDSIIEEGTMTLGLAFDGPQFKIDYSYQEHQVNDGKSMHGIDLRLPF